MSWANTWSACCWVCRRGAVLDIVSDEDVVAAVLFVERRYLYGQAVLNRCVVEQYWRGFYLSADPLHGDSTAWMLRVLRLSPGCIIDAAPVCSADLLLKRPCATARQP